MKQWGGEIRFSLPHCFRQESFFLFFVLALQAMSLLDCILYEGTVKEMDSSLERTDEEITALYLRHVDTVYRLCFSFLKNRADAEDLTQECFLRAIASRKAFTSAEHEKAWLIVTASNLCKNALKHASRREEGLEEHPELPSPEGDEKREVLDAILRLPAGYKTVVYLYYYEGYTTPEIAAMLRCPRATVQSRLFRARKLLKRSLGGDLT